MIEHPPDFHISPMCCEGAKRGRLEQSNKSRAIWKLCRCNLLIISETCFVRNGSPYLLQPRGTGTVARISSISICFTPGDSHDNYRPIFWFTENDKQIYEKCFNVIHSDCYRVWGMTRTGCAGCPFGSGFEDELELIINNEPKLYKAVAKIFHNSYEYTRRYREYKNSHKTSLRRLFCLFRSLRSSRLH